MEIKKNLDLIKILNNLIESCDLKLSENLCTIRNLIDDFLNLSFTLEHKHKLHQVINGTNQMIKQIDQLLELISKNSFFLLVDWSLFLKKISLMNECIRLMEESLNCLMSTKNTENYQKLINLDQKLKNFISIKIFFSQNNHSASANEYGSRSLNSDFLKRTKKSAKSLLKVSTHLDQNLSQKKLQEIFTKQFKLFSKEFCLLEIYDKKIVCKLNYSIFDSKFHAGVLLKYQVDLK